MLKMTPKYRAWDMQNKKMIYSDGKTFVVRSNDYWALGETDYDWMIVGITSTYGVLMQFTGIVDSKGNNIYESDIVKVSYGVGEVIYHSGCYWIKWIDDKEANMELLGLDKTFRKKRIDIEVLGNVCEHKELLNSYDSKD